MQSLNTSIAKPLEKNELHVESYQVESRSGASLKVKKYFMNKKDNSKVIFFVSGILGHQESYQEFYKEVLLKTHIPIITFDFSGLGMSSGARAYLNKWSDYEDDFNSVLEKYVPKGQDNIIIAHSLGGAVFLSNALKNESKIKDYFSKFIVTNPLISIPKFKKSKALRFIADLSDKYRMDIAPDMDHHCARPKDSFFFDADPLVLKYMTLKQVMEINENGRNLLKKAYYINLPILFLLSRDNKLTEFSKAHIFSKAIQNEDKELYTYTDYHELFNGKNRDKIIRDIENWIKND